MDGLPPVVYQNTPVSLLADGAWNHLRYPLATDSAATITATSSCRLARDVSASVAPITRVAFTSVGSNDVYLSFTTGLAQPHRLVPDNQLLVRTRNGAELPAFVRAVFGGNADVGSLSDNYLIMRYQAKNANHASYVSDGSGGNAYWSPWTTPQLTEGWIKRVLRGLNPFNQRVTDLFNNSVNTDVSIVQQTGARWEGDVALNLDALNHAGLIESCETVLNRGKLLSIGGANDGNAILELLAIRGRTYSIESTTDVDQPWLPMQFRLNSAGPSGDLMTSYQATDTAILQIQLPPSGPPFRHTA